MRWEAEAQEEDRVTEPKRYLGNFDGIEKMWRFIADIGLVIAFVGALVCAVSFTLFPQFMFSTSDIQPTPASRTMAWIVLISTVVLLVLVVVLRKRVPFTRESLRSEQKVELWGGAAGLFILFTMGNHVTDDARNGLMGAVGLIFLMAPAVLLEPLALELKEREESEKDDREEAKHRELLAALSAVKGSPATAPAPDAAGRRRRFFGIRLGRRR